MRHALKGADRAISVNVTDDELRCVQLGCAFTLGGITYPPDSWLVQGRSDEYARAMTNDAFQRWRAEVAEQL